MSEEILGDINTKDLLLLNVDYNRPTKESVDFATVILKRVSTGEKIKLELPEPNAKIYIVKPEYRDFDYNKRFIEKGHLEERIVPYRKILGEIIKEGGKEYQDFFKSCIEKGAYRELGFLHRYPYAFHSDLDYEDMFRTEWALHYAEPGISRRLTKGFLDIETDVVDFIGFPTDECEINAVTFIDGDAKVCYTFLLRNDKNPLIEEFEKNGAKFREELHEAFDDSYGKFDYQIMMYDKEIELLVDLFKTIHRLKKDFIFIWNMSFDIPYIIARITKLGYDPAEIMCHPDFRHKYVDFRKDYHNFDAAHKKDYFKIADYSVYQDDMINYAKIRKANGKLQSTKLNAIGIIELNDTKLDYTDAGFDRKLPYTNYARFVMYNIKDVLLQFGIERRTNDMDTIFSNAYDNATNYPSLFNMTILDRNSMYLSLYNKMNLIMGNNANMDYTTMTEAERKAKEDAAKKERFEGALVGNPLLNSHEGMTLYGKKSKFVFNYVIDYDFSSLYPSIIISCNIGVVSMIGKVILEGFDHLNGDPTSETKFDAGKEFFEDLTTGDMTRVGSRYFNLPTTEDLLDKIGKKLVK